MFVSGSIYSLCLRRSCRFSNVLSSHLFSKVCSFHLCFSFSARHVCREVALLGHSGPLEGAEGPVLAARPCITGEVKTSSARTRSVGQEKSATHRNTTCSHRTPKGTAEALRKTR